MSYNKLSELTTKGQSCSIKVKVIRLWDSINNKTEELMGLDMILMDEKMSLAYSPVQQRTIMKDDGSYRTKDIREIELLRGEKAKACKRRKLTKNDGYKQKYTRVTGRTNDFSVYIKIKARIDQVQQNSGGTCPATIATRCVVLDSSSDK
ncbi:hypothetical protein EJB05_24388 [Eragrostis curvula]|uniref:Replication protein A 70 kDa DNA-binding subunit B/D first OB fold domain-containing protein n=1 Tax=Eragrostis curvula TaxID=38414 RepID=A0A5J9VB62_9POAL|nr:hypothetical protein EJB05_24388 [Eragrostis curvula]